MQLMHLQQVPVTIPFPAGTTGRQTVAMKLPLTSKNRQCAATLLWIYGASFCVKRSLLNRDLWKT